MYKWLKWEEGKMIYTVCKNAVMSNALAKGKVIHKCKKDDLAKHKLCKDHNHVLVGPRYQAKFQEQKKNVFITVKDAVVAEMATVFVQSKNATQVRINACLNCSSSMGAKILTPYWKITSICIMNRSMI